MAKKPAPSHDDETVEVIVHYHEIKLPAAGPDVVARELTVTFDHEGTRQTLTQSPDVGEEAVAIAAPEDADLVVSLYDINADGSRVEVVIS